MINLGWVEFLKSLGVSVWVVFIGWEMIKFLFWLIIILFFCGWMNIFFVSGLIIKLWMEFKMLNFIWDFLVVIFFIGGVFVIMISLLLKVGFLNWFMELWFGSCVCRYELLFMVVLEFSLSFFGGVLIWLFKVMV